MPNAINTFIDFDARTAKNAADGTDASTWADGVNNASCSPGIGIAVGAGAITESNSAWTLLDQNGLARTPQDSQSIGGIGYTDPAGWPSSGGVSGLPTRTVRVITVNVAGTGVIASSLGNATLASLATGWAAV